GRYDELDCYLEHPHLAVPGERTLACSVVLGPGGFVSGRTAGLTHRRHPPVGRILGVESSASLTHLRGLRCDRHVDVLSCGVDHGPQGPQGGCCFLSDRTCHWLRCYPVHHLGCMADDRSIFDWAGQWFRRRNRDDPGCRLFPTRRSTQIFGPLEVALRYGNAQRPTAYFYGHRCLHTGRRDLGDRRLGSGGCRNFHQNPASRARTCHAPVLDTEQMIHWMHTPYLLLFTSVTSWD